VLSYKAFIVSNNGKRSHAPHRDRRLKSKNPTSEAVRREREEEWR
jgi:hypothetical protein